MGSKVGDFLGTFWTEVLMGLEGTLPMDMGCLRPESQQQDGNVACNLSLGGHEEHFVNA